MIIRLTAVGAGGALQHQAPRTKAIFVMTPSPQQFASDNYAGICPEAWAAMAEANDGYAPAYGDDPWTQRAADAFRELFAKADAEVFFAFNGRPTNAARRSSSPTARSF